MKFLATIFSSLLLSSLVLAQSSQEELYNIPKGTNLLGGGFEILSSSDELLPEDSIGESRNSSFTRLSFSPFIGRFVKENLMVGAYVSYSATNSEIVSDNGLNSYTSEREDNSFSFGVFARQYYPIHKRAGVNINSRIVYFKGNGNRESIDRSFDNAITSQYVTTRNTQGVNFNLNMGIYYRLSKKFILETNLIGISASTSKADEITDNLNNNQTYKAEVNRKGINLDFINTFSFDQLITINFLF